MPVAIVLYGPKASGKSWVAQTLAQRLGVHHVDPDALVLGLLARGVAPDPVDGWLAPVQGAVTRALERHDVVAVEATGAWESDWRLAGDLEREGARVIRLWVSAPLEETLRRLRGRGEEQVPVGEPETRRIHAAATRRAADHHFDLRVDTGSPVDRDALVEAVAALIAQRGGGITHRKASLGKHR